MNGDDEERARVNLIVAKENMQNDKFLIALFEGRNIFVLIFFGRNDECELCENFSVESNKLVWGCDNK